MTFLAFALTATETGVPVWLVALAMVLDATMVVTAMLTGIIHV